MGGRVKSHVCFTVGSVVPWEKAILFGNVFAELPIVVDYLKKTKGVFLPTGPGQPERDWWDEGPLTERTANYRRILTARKHGLSPSDIEQLARGKMPDLLTYRGLSAAQLTATLSGPGTRHEFYEIKPRSLSGVEKGLEKVVWLKIAYGAKGLPYQPGLLYPRHFYPPDGVAELPLTMIDKRHESDWRRAKAIILRRTGVRNAELTLEVRPAPAAAGLLLYRICVTLEADDDSQLSDAKVIQTARELVNSFVMSAVAEKAEEVRWQVGAVARMMEPTLLERRGKRLEQLNFWKPGPVLFPQISLELVGGGLEILRPALPALRDAMNTRHVGLPGDRFMLCCDEAFYDAVFAPHTLLKLVQDVRHTPARWAEYARNRNGMGLRSAIQEASEIYASASNAATAIFKPMVDWAGKHPGEAVLIGVGVIVVSALTFWALPALVVELAALEASTLAASSGAMSATFIETAAMSATIMEEATALELAAAAQVNLDAAILATADAAGAVAVQTEATLIASATTIPAGATVGGVATAAEATLMRQAASAVGKRVVAEALKKSAPQLAGAGIGVTLMVASHTAFAAPPSARVPGGPVPPEEAFVQPVASMASRLFFLRPEAKPSTPFPGGSPEKRTPHMGEQIDAAKFSPDAAEEIARRGEKQYSCRYLGELIVS